MLTHSFNSVVGKRFPKHRGPSRPLVEVLEDRCAPAVLVVDSLADDVDPADGEFTLRERLTEANTNGEGDQIVFAVALQGQTINLMGPTPLPTITEANDLSIVGPGGVSDGIAIRRDPTAPPFRIFDIAAGVGTVNLMNMTITGGAVTAANDGGGINNLGTDTNLTNVNVINNDVLGTGLGGGLHNAAGATVRIFGSTISSNTSAMAGGGINNQGTLVLDTSTVANNYARFAGGGIENFGTGTFTITNSAILGNQVRGDTPAMGRGGGGIRNNSPGTSTITGTIIANNLVSSFASTGGQGGGGISTGAGTITVRNATITGNSDLSNLGVALEGGGISRVGPAVVSLGNSVVAENDTVATTTAVVPKQLEAGVMNAGGNFVVALGTDIGLGPLQDNGGPTLSRVPLPGSPLIDAGLAANIAGATTDQRGAGFPRTVGAAVDMGAVEFYDPATTTTLTVTQDGAAVTTTSTARVVTLQAAIASATAGVMPTGTVNFFDDPDGPAGPTAPVQLNNIPIQVSAASLATLANLNLPAGAHGLYAVYTPESQAFKGSASAPTMVTAHVADTIGVFDQQGIAFGLLDQNSNDISRQAFGYTFGFGVASPVMGNWNGSADGVSKPGIAVSMGGTLNWTLSDDNPPALPNLPSFDYGVPGQIPLAGDWNGDGTDGIGVYDPSTGFFLLRNTPTGGAPDFAFQLGGTGFQPVVGNWDGSADGTDEVGVYLVATGQWFLATNTPATGFPALMPVFAYGGGPNTLPVAGDWNGNGTDGIGIFFPGGDGFGRFLLRTTPTPGAPDVNGGTAISAGLGNWLPMSGNWGRVPNNINELTEPMPLLAAAGPAAGGVALLPAQLNTIVDAALGQLADAGVDPGVINALAQAEYVVGDLPAGYLGAAHVLANQVVVDADAAGNGWFVDVTPEEDSEFIAGSPVGMDLLTTVLHEMGHLAGRVDNDGTELMQAFLPEGVRRTDELDAVFSTGMLASELELRLS